MNELSKALQLRGFFIVEESGYLRLGKGSHPDDEKDLKQMLANLNIPVTVNNQKINGLLDSLDAKKFQEIVWYPAKNHEAGGNGGYRSWKYFIKRMYGPKVRTNTLETGVALFIKSLSGAGITPISSCDGHGKRSPYISFFGVYNACWFMVIYRNLLNKLELNYEWEIEKWNFSDPCLIAQGNTGNWNLELVLEDTSKMAGFLKDNGQKLSKLKRELFGANRNSIRKQLKEMSHNEIIEWMEQKCKIIGFL
ncbi:hypothetical protein V7147_24805 [Bacillus sp. JJ1521]|uniref:hypothetical protein n=1 Tax=Bacillus sp. JJ1521 TaxID=3122957 RepID=UPI002FFF074D